MWQQQSYKGLGDGHLFSTDPQNYLIAIEIIPAGAITFAIPVSDLQTNAARCAFVNAPYTTAGGQRRAPTPKMRAERNDVWHSTFDGTHQYVQAHADTWLNNLWRPTDEQLARYPGLRRNIEMVFIENFSAPGVELNWPLSLYASTTRQINRNEWFIGPAPDDGIGAPGNLADRPKQ